MIKTASLFAAGAFLVFWMTLLASQAHAAPVPAPATATVTFLAAQCPPSSTLYQRVTSGQDPNSGENGSATAVPDDIAAYGCRAASGYNWFLLGDSDANSVFMDGTLTNAATVSTDPEGYAGAATTWSSGTTVYVSGGAALQRRFGLRDFTRNGNNWVGLPFLDEQCYNDGYNNDNGDGIGWGAQALPTGTAAYCILYVVGPELPTPTPTATATATRTATPSPTATATPSATPSPTATLSPTATPSPAATPTSLPPTATATAVPTKDTPTTVPSPSATAAPKGAVIPTVACVLTRNAGKTFVAYFGYQNANDSAQSIAAGDANKLIPASAAVQVPTTFQPGNSAPFPSAAVRASFSSGTLAWSLTGPDGTTHVATASASSPACPAPTVEKTFVSATDSLVTWKLAPGYDTEMMVWDANAASCQAFNGAICGGIGGDGTNGKFVSSPSGSQYLLVTQRYTIAGDSCDVSNTATWALTANDTQSSVTASYKCAGAPALGWPLYGAGCLAAIASAWWLGRRIRWSR